MNLSTFRNVVQVGGRTIFTCPILLVLPIVIVYGREAYLHNSTMSNASKLQPVIAKMKFSISSDMSKFLSVWLAVARMHSENLGFSVARAQNLVPKSGHSF
jgi:hypothetical protein